MRSSNLSQVVEEFRELKGGQSREASGLAGIVNMTIIVDHASPAEAEMAYKEGAYRSFQLEEEAWLHEVELVLARHVHKTLNVSNATAASLAHSMLAEVLASRISTTAPQAMTTTTSTTQSTSSMHFTYSGPTLANRPVLPTVAGTTAAVASTTVVSTSGTWIASSTNSANGRVLSSGQTSAAAPAAPPEGQATTTPPQLRQVVQHDIEKPIIDALERFVLRLL